MGGVFATPESAAPAHKVEPTVKAINMILFMTCSLSANQHQHWYLRQAQAVSSKPVCALR